MRAIGHALRYCIIIKRNASFIKTGRRDMDTVFEKFPNTRSMKLERIKRKGHVQSSKSVCSY